MSQFGVILALVFSLVIAIFAIANNQPIEVNYLYGKAEVSAIIIILGSAILGALVIFLLSMFRQIRMGFQIRGLRNEIEDHKKKALELEKERERLMAQVEQFEMSGGGQAAVTMEQGKTGDISPSATREEDRPAGMVSDWDEAQPGGELPDDDISRELPEGSDEKENKEGEDDDEQKT